MSKQVKLAKIIGVGMFLIPILSIADDATATATATGTTTPAASAPAAPSAPAANPNEMSKDVWLEKIKAVVPEPICKGFMEDASISARLKERNISYEGCVGLIPAIADKCQKKYYDSLPAMINQESASKWGRTIGECIGGDFAINYLYSGASSNPSSTTAAPTAPAPDAPASQ